MTKIQSQIVAVASNRNETRELHKAIKRKRAILQRLVTRNEMLRVTLEIVKEEYMVKVGNLFIKDSQLDLQIIYYRNLMRLMAQGDTLEQAQAQLANTYYSQQIRMEEEEIEMNAREQEYQQRMANAAKPQRSDLKKLWRKLIAKYHPDLVQNPKDKQRREEIMKQVNKAYEAGDFDGLVNIETDEGAVHETSVQRLESILVMLDEEILKQANLYYELKASEWQMWKTKMASAKKRGKDIFKEIERRLLNDIVGKIVLLKSLQEQVLEREASV